MAKFDLPKIDLHLHLDGSVLPETVWELAHQQGVPLPAEDLAGLRQFIVVTADCRSVNDYLARFELPLQILQDAAALQRVTRELICLLADQGLAYAEIRFAPQLHLRRGLTQQDAVEAVLAGRQEGLAARPGMMAGILLCCMCVGPHTANRQQNLETVRLAAEYLGSGVVGLDLAGAEGLVPLADFGFLFEQARRLQLPFTCHAGDSQGPDTVRDALNFGARRIGHGHHIFDDPALCARAARDGVTLEICPTSNIQCQSQPGYARHPAKKLLQMGVPVTINTDNMILSGIDLDIEYAHCLEEMGFTRAELVQMLVNSARAAFLPAEEKLKLIARIQAAGAQFLQ